MCRGLAVCINKQGKVLCDGSQHHGDVFNNAKVKGEACDKYLKFEIMYPEWNDAVWDRGDLVCFNVGLKHNLLDKKAQLPLPSIRKKLDAWVKKNENFIKAQFFGNKLLLKNYKFHMDLSGVEMYSLNLRDASLNFDDIVITGMYDRCNNITNAIIKKYNIEVNDATLAGLLMWLNNRAGMFKKIKG